MSLHFFPSMVHWVKWLFIRFWKDGLLAKLQTKTSRSCIFSLFLPHNYQVSLIKYGKEYWNEIISIPVYKLDEACYFEQSLSTAKLEDNVLGKVCASVCPSPLSQLNRLIYDLDFFICKFTLTMARLDLQVKVVGQISGTQRSSNKIHYQLKVFVCVSVISGRMQIITRMRSIGF